MDELNMAQLLVTGVALFLLTTPLFVLAFLAGRRSANAGTIRQFEKMPSEIALGPGTWRAEFDGDEPDTKQVVQLEFRQVDSRIVGVGRAGDGTRHSFEGVLHQRHLCCICIDENRAGDWFGTVAAELLPGDREMVGMRSRWSPQSQSLLIRKATFTRVL